jgi:DNA (cytosine-5)-methyltransferase 1
VPESAVSYVADAKSLGGRAGFRQDNTQQDGTKSSDCRSDATDAHRSRRQQQRRPEPVPPEQPAVECSGWWESEPNVGRVAHGVPSRVDRLRCLGNAVVPQIVEVIGRQIIAHEERVRTGRQRS